MADINDLFAVNPALKDQFSKLPPNDQAIIMQNFGPKPIQGPNGPVMLDPSMDVAMRKEALTREGVLQGFQPTTPGAELSAANNPLYRGAEAVGEKLTEPGILGGVFNKIAAPGAGAGSAVGTTAHNILSNIPGLGGPEGIIPAAGAAGAHALGEAGGLLKSASTVAKGLQKAPGVAMDVLQAVKQKGAMGALKDALPTIGKENKINRLAERTLGERPSFGERVSNPVSADAKALYDAAQQQGPVLASDIADVAFQAFAKESSMASPNAKATKALGDLYNKFSNKPGGAAYADVLEEAQRLRLTAQGLEERFPQVAKTLHEGRTLILDTLDSVSPLAKQAGALYRKDILAKDILEKLRSPNPGVKLRNLLEQEPDVAKAFNLGTPKEVDKFIAAADKIGASRTKAQLIANLGVAGGAGLLGYVIHRKIFDWFVKD